MSRLDRKEAILGNANLEGLGLEIGPSYKPLLPKSDGYRIETLDYLSKEELIEKYESHSLDTSRIEDVDYIWRGEPYTELIGTDRYNYIIASHVIEHTTDFIQFINDCDALLKDDGILCLAIPNKLYCFDYFRPITPLAKFIDLHDGRHFHSPGTAAEYFLNVVSKGGQIAWSNPLRREFRFVHSLDEARNAIEKSQSELLDLHNWCFTPHHFLLIIQDLLQLGYTKMGVIDYYVPPNGSHEFYVQLSRAKYKTFDRMTLMNQIIRETNKVYSQNRLLPGIYHIVILLKKFPQLIRRAFRKIRTIVRS